MPAIKEFMHSFHLWIEKPGNSAIMVKDQKKRKKNYDDDF